MYLYKTCNYKDGLKYTKANGNPWLILANPQNTQQDPSISAEDHPKLTGFRKPMHSIKIQAWLKKKNKNGVPILLPRPRNHIKHFISANKSFSIKSCSFWRICHLYLLLWKRWMITSQSLLYWMENPWFFFLVADGCLPWGSGRLDQQYCSNCCKVFFSCRKYILPAEHLPLWTSHWLIGITYLSVTFEKVG